ncbi:MAG: restriction endonuclease subunit S [Comamonadaceae bacterium]|nr:MAG: restriction endonuclease subunit S [Comamonadaceae bacterium]
MSWPLAALGDIAPAKPIKLNGYTPSDRIWHVTLDQIESNTGLLLEKSIKPLSEAGSSTHAFDDRHVLYSKLRPYLNKVLLPDETGLGTTELVPMLPATGKLDRVYLAHYLKSKTFVSWISSQTAGAKMPRVSMNTFWEHEIPLPPLVEQKRIAAILDKADSLRRKNHQAIQLADQFLRAVFLELFGDPVTNPKGWELKPLKELTSKIGSGSTPRGGQSAYVEEGISLIRSLNIHDDKFLHKNLAFITDKQAAALSNVEVEKRDVLLNITGASVCRCSIVDDSILPARVNQHVCIIRAPELVPEYLLHMLISASYKRYLLNVAGSAGATREALTKDQVENLMIPVPPMILQEKFAAIKNMVKSVINKEKKGIYLPLFDSLSQKAFAGEL